MMGYSSTFRAGEVLNVITNGCIESTGSSNTWLNEKGEKFFFQVGRENRDGAITGSVYELKRVGEDVYGYPKGGFRVEPNGALTRFPKLSKAIRKAASREADIQVAFSKGDMFVVA